MVGYPEGMTDPSYKKQILILTYPLIGNYGVPNKAKDEHGILENFESGNIQINGLIVSDYSENYHHHAAKMSLGEWMEKEGVPGITGLDTRALTKKIREKGTMLGVITTDLKAKNPEFVDPNLENLVDQVSIKKPEIYGRGKKTLLLIDCGVKLNIVRNLVNRGYKVIRVPWNYDFLNSKYKFDGIFLSNGPGDPTMVKELIDRIAEAMKQKIPVVGICLGNQIIALAAGAKTYKLKYGHRSQNQPCIDLKTGRCYLTTQNHGFNIDGKSLPKGWETWFKNANDDTVEGIRHKTKPYASVQFHPESYPGPTDTNYIFDELLNLI
jgi:carbamoyl-phosphate synthase small subunit